MSVVTESLIRVAVQALALSALFVAAGREVVHRALPPLGRVRPLSFTYGAGYFTGLGICQIVFVLGARATGSARLGLWIGLGTLLGLFVAGARSSGVRARGWNHAAVIAAALLLVGTFTITNAGVWMPPAEETSLWQPLGSIHSGRYANYAIFIAEHDRVPRVAQDLGQSMMASWHLLLGSRAPLAALMSWIPMSLAALATLIFGLLREHGLSRAWSASGTYFVLLCNIALSLNAHFVFDNGCPLAVLGYTDAIMALGTFLLASVWLRDILISRTSSAVAPLVLPLILSFAWSWSAPQNLVIAGATVAVVLLVWARSQPMGSLLRRLAGPALALHAGSALAAMLLGPFLPAPLREDIGLEVVPVRFAVRVRPYVMYLVQHWTLLKGVPNVPGFETAGELPYGVAIEEVRARGEAWVLTTILDVFENQLWSSLRIYGFLVLGVVLLGARLRTLPLDFRHHERLRAWFWIALASFLTGYLVVFLLEVDRQKWWLGRFLLPGAGGALVGFVLAFAPIQARLSVRQTMLRALVILLGTLGPIVECGRTAWGNLVETSLDRRLELLAMSRGPFVEPGAVPLTAPGDVP